MTRPKHGQVEWDMTEHCISYGLAWSSWTLKRSTTRTTTVLKNWKSRFSTFHYSATLNDRVSKFVLLHLIHAKLYQNNFRVSISSGSWISRYPNVVILAVFLQMYVICLASWTFCVAVGSPPLAACQPPDYYY